MYRKLPAALKVTAIAVALTLSGCGSQSVEEHFVNAEKYTQAHDYKSSVISLKKILIEQPENIVAREKLATAYVSLNKYREAEKELKHLLEGKKSTPENIALMAEVKFEIKKYAEVYMLAYKVSDINSDASLRANFFAVLSAIQDRNKDKVQEFIKQTGAISKTSHLTKVAQAWVALEIGEKEESRLLVDQALKQAPNFNQALFLSARLFDVNGQISEAKDVYKKYVKLYPYDIDKKMYLYQAHMSLGEIDAAESVIDSVYVTHPKNPLVNLFRSQVHYQKKEYQKSNDLARNVLKDLKEHMPAKLVAAASAYKLGDYKQAYNYLSTYEKSLTTGEVKRMLTLSKLKLGMINEVADDILKSSDEHVDIDILMLTSMNLTRTGQQDKALALLEGSSGENNAKVIAQQGLTRLSVNDFTGISLLEKSIEMDGSLEGAKLALAMAHLRSGNTDEAIKIATEWEGTPDTKVLGQLLNANIYKKEGKHELAEALFVTISKSDKDNVAAKYALAQYDESRYDTAKALVKYIDIVNLYPGHVNALSRITELNLKAKDVQKTLDVVEPLLSKHDDNVKLRLSVAYNHFLNDDPQRAIETLLVITPDAQTPDVYYIILGDSYMKQELMGNGINTYKSLVKKNPANLLGQLRYISSLEFAKRFASALHATKNAKIIFKSNKALDLLEIRYGIRNNNADNALLDIAKFRDNYETTTELMSYEAQAYVINKNFKKAAETYVLANKFSQSLEYQLGAASAFMNLDEPTKASEILENAYTTVSKEDKVKVAMFIGEVNYGVDFEKSYKYFKEAITTKPDDAIINNNLAMVSIELGKNADALKYSKVSYRENSAHTSILNTYGSALVVNMDYKEGVKILEQSIKLGSNDVDAMIYLAQAYSKLGDFTAEHDLLLKAMKQPITPEQKAEIMKMRERL